jgi:thiol-disulfide isomerase/thioredoxin
MFAWWVARRLPRTRSETRTDGPEARTGGPEARTGGPEAREGGPADRHPAALLAAAVAGVHLVGGLLRPSPPALDEIIDVLVGLLALAIALLAATGRLRRVPPTAFAAGGVVAALVVLTVVVAAPRTTSETTPSAAAPVSGPDTAAAGLLTASGDRASWDLADLQDFVAAGDGRPVVVSFWASWCPPCHAEAPVLARTARALEVEAVFVGVLVDDEVARARAFEDRYDLPFPTVVDGGVWPALAGAGLPTTVVLRGDGSVASTLIGGVDARRLAAAVDAAGR